MSSAWLLSYDGRVENDGFDRAAKLDVHCREADIKILQQQQKKNLCMPQKPEMAEGLMRCNNRNEGKVY